MYVVYHMFIVSFFFFFSSRRRHTRCSRDWSSDVCSSDLNQEWVNPHDPDARITKMKDGRTHLAHKAEHAVDLQTGAVLAVTLQEADQGDTTTIVETLAQAGGNVAEVIAQEAEETADQTPAG